MEANLLLQRQSLNLDQKELLSLNRIKDFYYHCDKNVYCAFGCHLEDNPNRFQRMKKHHLDLYNYCMDYLKMKEVLNYMKVDHA